MAVLIMDVDMPESCRECLLGDEYGECCILMGRIEKYGRRDDCPLREIKLPPKADTKLLEDSGFEL